MLKVIKKLRKDSLRGICCSAQGIPCTYFFATEIPCMDFIPHRNCRHGFCFATRIPSMDFVWCRESLHGFLFVTGIPCKDFVWHRESQHKFCLALGFPVQNNPSLYGKMWFFHQFHFSHQSLVTLRSCLGISQWAISHSAWHRPV